VLSNSLTSHLTDRLVDQHAKSFGWASYVKRHIEHVYL